MMFPEHVPDTPALPAIREETRSAYEALVREGVKPSMRTLRRMGAGGKQSILLTELRQLHAAHGIAAYDPEADAELPSTADPPDAPTPLEALTRRVERLEQQLEPLEDTRQLWRQCVQDPRTWKSLVLWTQRTVGQTRSPLTALVEQLARLD